MSWHVPSLNCCAATRKCHSPANIKGRFFCCGWDRIITSFKDSPIGSLAECPVMVRTRAHWHPTNFIRSQKTTSGRPRAHTPTTLQPWTTAPTTCWPQAALMAASLSGTPGTQCFYSLFLFQFVYWLAHQLDIFIFSRFLAARASWCLRAAQLGASCYSIRHPHLHTQRCTRSTPWSSCAAGRGQAAVVAGACA